MPHHLARIDLLRLQLLREVVARIRRARRDQLVDVAPVLCPDVAEQVRRDRLAPRHQVEPVLLAQFLAHVAVQRIVQRLDLPPQTVHFRGERIGRHVVVRAP